MLNENEILQVIISRKQFFGRKFNSFILFPKDCEGEGYCRVFDFNRGADTAEGEGYIYPIIKLLSRNLK